jgi:hypothetical protein
VTDLKRSFDGATGQSKRYKAVGMGFGKRSAFPEVPHLTKNPGPADYEAV